MGDFCVGMESVAFVGAVLYAGLYRKKYFVPEASMTSDVHQQPLTPNDATIASASRPRSADVPEVSVPREDAPWLVRQALDHPETLSIELAARFPGLPLMTVIRLREIDAKTGRALAVLTSSDGVAAMRIELDATSHLLEFTFGYGGMLALRFQINGLSVKDRANFLERMQLEGDHSAYLWGEARWTHDYLIGVSRRQGKNQFINLYAFSRHNTEAAVRLKPDVCTQLLDWLADHWKEEEVTKEQPSIPSW